MTVAELIGKLQTMPQDALVVVRGYENGVDKALDVLECGVVKKDDSEDWDGAYSISDSEGIKAVYIKSDCDERHLHECD